MSLKYSEIKDAGNFMKERIVFTVDGECQLGHHLVAHSKIINDTAFSSKLQDIYWFPDKIVAAGDLVVLYTKRGENNVTINEDNTKTHFYYWGLDKPLSSTERECIVLLDASWRVSEVPISEAETEE